MSTPPADNRIRFDKTVNLGHLITMGAFLLAGFVQWNIMDKRVTVLEESRSTQRERDGAQDSATKDKAQEVKDALTELKRSIEKLSDKMETQK